VSDSPELVVRRFLASWVKSDIEEIASFFNSDAVYVDGPSGTRRGLKDIRATLSGHAELVPSTTVEIKAIVADGPTVIVERVDNFEMGGTPLFLEAVGVFEIDDDARITRWRDYYDMKSTIDQIEAAGVSIPD
jgi:limonene-1,2-epoxide hydrolase